MLSAASTGRTELPCNISFLCVSTAHGLDKAQLAAKDEVGRLVGQW